ncbi:MAG: gamma-glutamyl-gamma-aminobutyrate hydrolase family protein, partial [Planctomycetota bacterium]
MTEPPLRIGLNCDVFPASDDPAVRRRCGVWLDYVDLLGSLGASPVLLPPAAASLAWLEELDGVLLIGGDDYRAGNPAGEPENFLAVDARREEFDLAISREVVTRDIPTLAICGGFQLQVLVEGG